MEKILKETNVNPKVTISVEEYNSLVSLARANAQQIEKRAVEYYKKHGACTIHVDAYIRDQYCGMDTIESSFSFDCNHCYVMPSGEYVDTPFAIDQKTRQRICRFVSEYVSSAFKNAFGKQLMSINNAKRYEYQVRRDWRLTRILTLVGWLLALLLIITQLLMMK